MRRHCDLGYLPRYCGAFLEGLAGVLPDPARVVEIGTGPGCSLHRILCGLAWHEDAHVWTIDIEEIDVDRIMDGEFEDRYTAINKDSSSVAKDWKIPLDMIYVDGDHSYGGCISDIINWGPHLKDGGIIAFDDYGFFCGQVEKAVDDTLLAKEWRFIGRIGRLIAFEKTTGGPLDWYKGIAWMQHEKALSMKVWVDACLGMK